MQITYAASHTGAQLHASNKVVRGFMGPVGNGKSVACINECLRLSFDQWPNAQGIRKSRGVIVRNTGPELRTTVLNTWRQWVPESIAPIALSPVISCTMKQPLSDGTRVEMEVYFLALDSDKDVKKLLSLEATWIFLNEARELSFSVVKAARERIGRYPSAVDGYQDQGSYKAPRDETGALHPCKRKALLMDTNPPGDDHWWYQLAEEGCLREAKDKDEARRQVSEVFDFFRGPSPLLIVDGKYVPNPAAENIDHLPGGYKYYLDMLAGNTAEHVNVMVLGNYGNLSEGRPVYPHYNDRVHCPPEGAKAIKGLPIGLGWDFGLCYDDKTEVLTQAGWKMFADVCPESDKVATRNPDTGEMTYTDINFKVDREYNGKMLLCETANVNFCVTPEHRIPFTRRGYPNEVIFKEAQWVMEHATAHLFIDVTSSWSSGERGPVFGMDAKTFAGLMGIYLSEGSTDKRYNRIAIYQNNQHPDIQAMLDKTGLKWTWSPHGSWRVSDPLLAAFLRPLGGANQKRIPEIVRSLPADCLEEFIKFYTLGDGHIRIRENGSEEHTCFTTSSVMAGDLLEVAQKIGWYGSVRSVSPRQSVIQEGGLSRVITSRHVGYNITFKKRANRVEMLKGAWSEVDYSGRIYCLNVPFHTLYVKRGGKPHWNGNTPAVTIGQLTPQGQLRTVAELVSEDMDARTFARDVVKPFLAKYFKDFEIAHSYGDPAGNNRGEGEGKSAIGILNDDYLQEGDDPIDLGFYTEPAPTNDPTQRIDAVSRFMTRMVNGEPGYLLNNVCTTLRKAKQGAYCFKRVASAGKEGVYRDKPDKNKYSHASDAEQYMALGFVQGYQRQAADEGEEHYYAPRQSGAMGY